MSLNTVDNVRLQTRKHPKTEILKQIIHNVNRHQQSSQTQSFEIYRGIFMLGFPHGKSWAPNRPDMEPKRKLTKRCPKKNSDKVKIDKK